MKKILSLLGTAVLITSGSSSASCAFITNKNINNDINDLYKKNIKNNFNKNFTNKNIRKINTQHTPEEILDNIKKDHILVPSDTNPSLYNPSTQTAILNSLKNNNPYITDDDLKLMTIKTDGLDKLNNKNYVDLYIIITKGSDVQFKKIYSKISNIVEKPAINLYDPLQQIDQYNIDDINKDYIFLRSLSISDNNQITSSAKKLSSSDIEIYNTKMGSHDKSKNDIIYQGLSLINKYIKNGLLTFNQKGHIPTKEDLMSSNGNDKQSVITLNPKFTSSNTHINIAGYVTLDIHWNYINIKLQPKIMNKVFTTIVNKVLLKALKDKFGIEIQDSFDVFKGWIKKYMKLELAATGDSVEEEITVVLDVGDPAFEEVNLVIEGVMALLIMQIVNKVEDTFLNAIYKIFHNKNFIDIADEDSNITNKLPQYPQYNNDHPYIFKIPNSFSNAGNKSIINTTLSLNIHYIDMWNDYLSMSCEVNPYVTPERALQPSSFNPSLGVQSMISGNPDDFTIVANSASLYDFSERIAKGDPIAANTTQELFKDMQWNNVSEFNTDPNFLIELNNLYSKSEASYWKVPGGYMGLIHIKKINGALQIVWSNLNNNQDKQSLKDTGIEGFITTSFLNQNNNFEALLNERNYLNIETRYVWIMNNWDTIKKDPVISSNPRYQGEDGNKNYFEDLVLKDNGINMFDFNIKNNFQIFQSMLEQLGKYNKKTKTSKTQFKNLIDASGSLNSKNDIINIFINKENNKLNIQNN